MSLSKHPNVLRVSIILTEGYVSHPRVPLGARVMDQGAQTLHCAAVDAKGVGRRCHEVQLSGWRGRGSDTLYFEAGARRTQVSRLQCGVSAPLTKLVIFRPATCMSTAAFTVRHFTCAH